MPAGMPDGQRAVADFGKFVDVQLHPSSGLAVADLLDLLVVLILFFIDPQTALLHEICGVLGNPRLLDRDIAQICRNLLRRIAAAVRCPVFRRQRQTDLHGEAAPADLVARRFLHRRTADDAGIFRIVETQVHLALFKLVGRRHDVVAEVAQIVQVQVPIHHEFQFLRGGLEHLGVDHGKQSAVRVPEEGNLCAVRLVKSPSHHAVMTRRRKIFFPVNIVGDRKFIAEVHRLGGLLGIRRHGRGNLIDPGNLDVMQQEHAAFMVDRAGQGV
ncbi:MAG: hypothetical protein BWX45_00463 [Deltaproteobacteria bacterium ADurb.Bin002]|nr:MAG: hypothetical protein BWX45_00463 [Deltaproteobacteria bacterium ADurb.Bin002]